MNTHYYDDLKNLRPFYTNEDSEVGLWATAQTVVKKSDTLRVFGFRS